MLWTLASAAHGALPLVRPSGTGLHHNSLNSKGRLAMKLSVPVSLALAIVLSFCMNSSLRAQAPAVSLTQISSDPFSVGPGQHATEVEPHLLANGSTLVAAFQTGRIAPGGST